jgi:hypothetical protein
MHEGLHPLWQHCSATYSSFWQLLIVQQTPWSHRPKPLAVPCNTPDTGIQPQGVTQCLQVVGFKRRYTASDRPQTAAV